MTDAPTEENRVTMIEMPGPRARLGWSVLADGGLDEDEVERSTNRKPPERRRSERP